MIRRSRVVIVICPSLEDTVREIDPSAAPCSSRMRRARPRRRRRSSRRRRARRTLGLTNAVPVILYTGTFEAYQGLDLLFEAMVAVKAVRPDASLVLVGGKPDQVARARQQAERAGVGDVTIFAGERPAAEIPAYSPRR